MENTRRPARPGSAPKPPLTGKGSPPAPALDRAVRRPSQAARTGLADPAIQQTLDELESQVDALFGRMTLGDEESEPAATEAPAPIAPARARAGPDIGETMVAAAEPAAVGPPPVPARERTPDRPRSVAPLEWGALPSDDPPRVAESVRTPRIEPVARPAAPPETPCEAAASAIPSTGADAAPTLPEDLDGEIDARLDAVIVPEQPVVLPEVPPHVVARRAAADAERMHVVTDTRRWRLRAGLAALLALGAVAAAGLVLRLGRDGSGEDGVVQAGALVATVRPDAVSDPSLEDEAGASALEASEALMRSIEMAEGEAGGGPDGPAPAPPDPPSPAQEPARPPVGATAGRNSSARDPEPVKRQESSRTENAPAPRLAEVAAGPARPRAEDAPRAAAAAPAARASLAQVDPPAAPKPAPGTFAAAPPVAVAEAPERAAAVVADTAGSGPLIVAVPPRVTRPATADGTDPRVEATTTELPAPPASPAAPLAVTSAPTSTAAVPAGGPDGPTSTGLVPSYEPPRVIERFDPVYPERARRQNKGGRVVLKVFVSEEGRVVRVVVEEGAPDPEFEAAAIDAVLRWRYRPAQEHGHVIRGWTTETFDFEP